MRKLDKDLFTESKQRVQNLRKDKREERQRRAVLQTVIEEKK